MRHHRQLLLSQHASAVKEDPAPIAEGLEAMRGAATKLARVQQTITSLIGTLSEAEQEAEAARWRQAQVARTLATVELRLGLDRVQRQVLASSPFPRALGAAQERRYTQSLVGWLILMLQLFCLAGLVLLMMPTPLD